MTIQFFVMQGAAVRKPARFVLASTAFATSLLTQPLLAQEKTLTPTLVTAARMQQTLAQVTADVTIIDQDEIERAGPIGIADLLARAPGIQISRNGGLGQQTSVFLRGTSNQHSIVLIDGVRYGTQEMQGGAPWANLPLGQIERIEILRGPAAAVYGSDAIGGVIQIFTRKAQNGEITKYLEAGVGTHNTRKIAAGIANGVGSWTYALNAVDQRSDGFDAYPGNTWGANPDKDGYANSSLGFNVGYRQGIHELNAGLHYTRQKGEYDRGTPPFNDYDTNKTTIANIKWAAQWNSFYKSEVQLSQTLVKTDRHLSVPESLKANSRTLLWQNILNLQGHKLNFNVERIEDRFDTDYASTQNVDEKRIQNAIALGWNYTTGAHTLNAHLRHDNVPDQKSKTTGGLGYGLQLNDQWRWVASAGTAFRNPTLYERFTGQSVPNLKPESSRNVETGLYFEQDQHQVSVVAYRNRVTDLIAWDSTCSIGEYGCYNNIDSANFFGSTLSASTTWNNWHLGATFDWLQAKDLKTKKTLVNRSQRTLKFNADTRVDSWSFGGEVQLYSQRQANAANTKQLPGYGLLNLYAERALGRDFSLAARVNNLSDKDFQPTEGYASAGRTVFVSLKWAPK